MRKEMAVQGRPRGQTVCEEESNRPLLGLACPFGLGDERLLGESGGSNRYPVQRDSWKGITHPSQQQMPYLSSSLSGRMMNISNARVPTSSY
jgi:hypothetical protein